jgi:hypothetical protein
MAEFNISVDVCCYKPDWTADLRFEGIYQNSIYRLFLDSVLLVERTWVWDNNTAVRENFWIPSEPDNIHQLRVDTIVTNHAEATFSIKNLKVNGYPKPTTGLETSIRM